MQVQKINNSQNFGMALKKPKGLSAKNISEMHQGSVYAANEFASMYKTVQREQKNNKFCNIIFDNATTAKPEQINQYSIKVVDKKTKKNIATYIYEKIKAGNTRHSRTTRNNLLIAMNDANRAANKYAEKMQLAKETKTVDQILNEAYSSKDLGIKDKASRVTIHRSL